MRALVGASCGLLLFACACGGKKGSLRQADRPADTVGEAIAMLLEMGEVVMSAEAECDLMATVVGRWLDANGAKLEQINAELLRIQSPETEEAYRQRLALHMDVLQGMKAGVEGCRAHAGFMRAWNRLDE